MTMQNQLLCVGPKKWSLKGGFLISKGKCLCCIWLSFGTLSYNIIVVTEYKWTGLHFTVKMKSYRYLCQDKFKLQLCKSPTYNEITYCNNQVRFLGIC